MIKPVFKKRISKLRLYYAASSSFILAVIPTFLLLTTTARVTADKFRFPVPDLAVYLVCFLGITIWIYNSDSEFQIYYCKNCHHEWPKKRHNQETCPQCGSENWAYNYRP